MATNREIRYYAKAHNISRSEAKAELNAAKMARSVLPSIIQHTMPRITYEEFASAVPTLMKKAYDNGEMEVPLTEDTTILNPRTPNISKLQTMMMKVGNNRSPERAKAIWLFSSSMQEICMKDKSVEEQQKARNDLKDIHSSIVSKEVA